jgi:hypothetical protein
MAGKLLDPGERNLTGRVAPSVPDSVLMPAYAIMARWESIPRRGTPSFSV